MSNAILLSLPDAEYRRVRPHLQFVNLPHHENLHEPGRKLKFAYFLNTGMISLILVGRDGKSVEIGVTGKEGFTPIPLAVGLKRSPHRAIVQVAGEGFRLSVAALDKLLSGTVQNDILKEYVARGTYIYPPRASLRIVTDIFAYCDRELPNWNTISNSGYHVGCF